jgi:hypothetical protein
VVRPSGDIQIYRRIMGKVLVSFDDRVLREIDRAARERGMSRSAYLSELAERELGLSRGPGARPEVQAALKALDELFDRNPIGTDPAADIRAMRDERAEQVARRTRRP